MGERKHTYEDESEYFRLLHESPETLTSGLPLRGSPDPVRKSRRIARPVPNQRTHEKFILAGHLIITGYAHWLSNDLRGSGSIEIRRDDLKELGDIHLGRKRDQPSREEIREFYRRAEPLLQHQTIWFDPAKRQAVADGFAQVVRELGYTVWACAVLRNHAHLVVRRHRDKLEVIWDRFASGAARVLKVRFPAIAPDHPVWAHRPHAVYIYDPPGIRSRIKYVNDNPRRSGCHGSRIRSCSRTTGRPTANDVADPACPVLKCGVARAPRARVFSAQIPLHNSPAPIV